MNNIAHYTDMKDSGIKWIGMVPASWNVRTLYQLVTRVNNKNSDLAEKNLLSLSYGKIKRKDINTTDGLLPASFDGYNIIEGGDIVLRLTDLQNDHTSLRVGHATERGIITSAYTTLRPINSANSRYLYYLIHAFDLKKGFYGMGSGVRQGLNYDEVKELRVVLPSQEEQDAIVHFLDETCAKIDEIIEFAKTTIDEYQKWEKSVIFDAVTKGIYPGRCMKDSGFAWIGEIPQEWDVQKVKYGFIRKNSKAEQENPIVLSLARSGVRVRDMTETKGQFAESYYNYNPVAIGDLLLNPMDLYSGANCSYSRVEGVISPAYINLRAIDGYDPIYYDYYFKVQYWTMAFFAHGKGVSFDNRWTLNTETLFNFPIIVPPLEEQKVIAEFLVKKHREIDPIISEKQKLISTLENYKRSLIYETVTGKRKVV